MIAWVAGCGGQALLTRFELNESELPRGVRLQTVSDGDHASLHLCDADFPSEALREARLQQVAIDKNGPDLGDRGAVGIESIVYDSAASGAQALDELRSAVESCPDPYRVVPIAGTRLGPVAPDHLAIDVTSDASGDEKQHAIVYQRRGRVLVALFGRNLATIAPYVPVVASRLAALSEGEAGE